MNKRTKRDVVIAAILGFLSFIAIVTAGITLGWDSPTQAQDHEEAIRNGR